MREVASQPPELLAESPDLQNAFFVGERPPELEVVAIRLVR
jgi:hypothetical protein